MADSGKQSSFVKNELVSENLVDSTFFVNWPLKMEANILEKEYDVPLRIKIVRKAGKLLVELVGIVCSFRSFCSKCNIP